MANTLQGQTEDLFPETIVKTGSTEPEYGLSREAETGLVGAITNPFVPVKREVLQPEETIYTQRIDSEPGVYDKKYTPAEYGEPEYDFQNAPIVRGTKSALAYAKKLFSSEEAQEQAVDVAKQIPAMGAKLIEDQMQTALGMQQGASALVDKEGNETVYDPSLAVGAVAPAGIVAISQAKAGETVLGIFGGALARTGEKRFDELKDVVKNVDEKQLTFNTPKEREEYLFQKSKGVFLGEDKIPRFEIATKDVKLIPYFKKRGALDKTDNEQEQIYAVPEDETMKSELVLADVVKFDELFKEYPELKKYKVKRLPDEEREKGIRGTFNPRTKTFEIADLNEKEFTSIALHEVQHAVDDLEKRQAGSSTEMFATDAMLLEESAGENLKGNSNNFFYFRTNPETSENFSKYTPEELDVLNNKEHQMLMVHMYSDEFAKDKNFDEFREIYNPIISKFADWEQKDFKDLINLRNEYDEITAIAAKDKPVAFEKYITTSGEVDARNVEARFLNPELQLTVPPKYTADRKKNLDLVTSSGNSVSKSIDETIPVFPKPERMFPEGDRPKGGKYLNPITGDDLTGMNVPNASLKIKPDGKPSFNVTNKNVESVGTTGKGNTQIKTNLFKSKAGWKWKSSTVDTDNINTLISVTHKGKHYYTLETDFSKGVTLKNYPESKTEPKLRPTVQGQIEMGSPIGTISVRGKEHPVYDKVITFAEGGAVPMKEQMSMFEDGGLMDEGGSIDPVSGNDVPPGSTQEEVRDDIPAQLSEGEFVFPADVVRYFGLETLMKMRQEAKAGLQRMEDMGQMGNSDEAIMSDTLPFDINDLDMEDDGEYNNTQEFAVGGTPTANTNTGVYYTPAASQSTTGVTAPQPVQAASSQYVAPQQQAVPTAATTATPTYESFIKPVEGTAPTIKEYINTKTGEKMSITFVNNQPTIAIPTDFVPASEYVAPETVASQTSRVKSTKQVDEPAGREEIEKEEAMFGSGGGRISLGGNVDKGRVSGATQFGVAFSGMGGLPGVGSMAMTALGLATGKPIPDDARATITRDGLSVTISGTDYNKMKAEKFRGKTSDSIMDKWQQEKNEVNKQKDLREYKRQALEELAAKSAEEIKAEKAEQDRQMRAAFSKFADPSGDGGSDSGNIDTSALSDLSSGGDEDVTGDDFGYGSPDDFESDLG